MNIRPTGETGPICVAVIGAGIVGLSTAWFLQEGGAEVVILDRGLPGQGATLGNAGWITPDLVEPLPSPDALRQGVISGLRPGSPIAIRGGSPALIAFLLRFLMNCSKRRHEDASQSLSLLSRNALQAFDRLEAGGAGSTFTSSILAVFSSEAACDSYVASHLGAGPGHKADVMRLSGDETRALEPSLTSEVRAAALIHGQRYLDPEQFTARLAAAIEARGGQIRSGIEVDSVHQLPGGGVSVDSGHETVGSFDAVVLANGAELPKLAAAHGLKIPMAAGRGYSFSTQPMSPPRIPIYIPEQRLACTPLSEGYRIVGVMEFAAHGKPQRRNRIAGMLKSAQPFFRDIAAGTKQNPWVGSRPCTPDGLPVLGGTQSKGVFVAGGHGMWGITLGPISGQLVAKQILGNPDTSLAAFDPLR